MEVMRNKVCRTCGKPIPNESQYATVCPECSTKNRSAARNKMRTCIDCGKEFMGYPKSKRCPECQSDADKRHNAEYRRRRKNGVARVIGQFYSCDICGKEYMLTSGQQKYCPDCKEAATKAQDAALTRKWNNAHYDDAKNRKYVARVCVICGKPIPRGCKKVTCSPTCSKEREIQRHRAALARKGIGEMPESYVPTRSSRKSTPPEEKKTVS